MRTSKGEKSAQETKAEAEPEDADLEKEDDIDAIECAATIAAEPFEENKEKMMPGAKVLPDATGEGEAEKLGQ